MPTGFSRKGTKCSSPTNLFTGGKRNIEHLHRYPRFESIRHDFTFPLYVEVDEIHSLAYPASPIHYQHDLVQMTKTSVLGAINMLGLAKQVKVRRSIKSSTIAYIHSVGLRPWLKDFLSVSDAHQTPPRLGRWTYVG